MDLINATGKSKTFVSLIASGTKKPSMDLFLEIVNRLDIPVEDYFEDTSLVTNQEEIDHHVLEDSELQGEQISGQSGEESGE